MAKYCIYAVGYGIDPATREPVVGKKCGTWAECEKYVKGVERAKFKGFLTDAEADKWLEKVKEKLELNDDGGRLTSQPSSETGCTPPVASVKARPSDDVDVDAARSQFIDICKAARINPNDMVNKLIVDFVGMFNYVNFKAQVKEAEEILPFN